MRSTRSRRLAVLLALLAPILSGSAAFAAVFSPTKTTDSLDGSCDRDCSLREAIVAANANAGEDVILLPAGTFTSTLAGAGEQAAASGDLDVNGDLIVIGAGASKTVIDGGGLDRVLEVAGGVSVELRDVTLRHGQVAGPGAGIVNAGHLVLRRCVVTGNAATSGETGSGGGIQSLPADAQLEVFDSTIFANTATGVGGGLALGGHFRFENTTISGNLTTSTTGGGLYVTEQGDGSLRNLTITGNRAASRAGGAFIENRAFVGFPPSIANTVLAGNTAPERPDCEGTFDSQGHNLVGDGSQCDGFGASHADLVGTGAARIDPKLGPLTANGGPTATHALLAGSPALDAGDSAAPGGGTGSCAGDDQRGAARPGGSRCDIGAFEQTTQCVSGGAALCLQHGRFKVTATFKNGATTGIAMGEQLTADSGTFWFFDPANVELTVKMVEGCGLNHRFWAFSSGLTDLQVTLTYVDTLTGVTKTYTNPAGVRFRPRFDTGAFACS